MMSGLWADLRYTFRQLRRNPSFTTVAVLALALGIGANTAIFTVVYSLLLKPLPFPDANQLVLIARSSDGGISETLSGHHFSKVRDSMKSLSSVSAYDVIGNGVNLTGAGEPERVPSLRVSRGYFGTVGVKPRLGREFTAEEDTPNGPKVAVISHGLWMRRFGGDPAVVGRTLLLGGAPHQLVGVMPSGFAMKPEADVLVPLQDKEDPAEQANIFMVLGRLRDGTTLQQANSEAAALGAQVRAAFPRTLGTRQTYSAISYRDYITGEVRPALLVLLAAVGCVLLIACANVANLLLARAAARQKEISLRVALGAGTGRLIRQMLTESAVLGLLGGVAGVLLAFAMLKGVVVLNPNLPRADEIGIDGIVLGFTVLLSALTGIFFGLVPALHAARGNLAGSLHETSSRNTGTSGRGRLRKVLVGVEVATAVVLLAGAALLLQSFGRLSGVDPGFQPEHVLTLQLALNSAYQGTEKASGFLKRVTDQIKTVPGVDSAAVVTSLPMEIGPDMPTEVVGLADSVRESQWRYITPEFFRAMGMKMLQGRQFTENDTYASEPVIVINEAQARAQFPNQSPIGQRLQIGRSMGPMFTDKPRLIVGVVSNVREKGPDTPVPPAIYIPVTQVPEVMMRIGQSILPFAVVVKTAGRPMDSAQRVRQAVLTLDRDQPIARLRPLSEVVDKATSGYRFNAFLLGLFAALSLVLAAVGIYGVLSYSVAQRTPEIGVRLAMGAAPADVLRIVLNESLRPAIGGIIAGLALAFVLTRFLEKLLYGVTARDPMSFLLVPLILLGVSALASLWPAIRALRVDPMRALRYE